MIVNILTANSIVVKVVRNPEHPFINAVKTFKLTVETFISLLDILRVNLYPDAISIQVLTNTQCNHAATERVQH